MDSLSAPTKAWLNKKVTGQNIYNLALQMVRNLKKVIALADQWLAKDDNLPSGNTWNDLNDYVFSKSTEISKEKNNYTGLISFKVLTKY